MNRDISIRILSLENFYFLSDGDEEPGITVGVDPGQEETRPLSIALSKLFNIPITDAPNQKLVIRLNKDSVLSIPIEEISTYVVTKRFKIPPNVRIILQTRKNIHRHSTHNATRQISRKDQKAHKSDRVKKPTESKVNSDYKPTVSSAEHQDRPIIPVPIFPADQSEYRFITRNPKNKKQKAHPIPRHPSIDESDMIDMSLDPMAISPLSLTHQP